jgi:hypothetical protein
MNEPVVAESLYTTNEADEMQPEPNTKPPSPVSCVQKPHSVSCTQSKQYLYAEHDEDVTVSHEAPTSDSVVAISARKKLTAMAAKHTLTPLSDVSV